MAKVDEEPLGKEIRLAVVGLTAQETRSLLYLSKANEPKWTSCGDSLVKLGLAAEVKEPDPLYDVDKLWEGAAVSVVARDRRTLRDCLVKLEEMDEGVQTKVEYVITDEGRELAREGRVRLYNK